MQSTFYESKVDTWLGAVLVLGAAGSVVAAAVVLLPFIDLPQAWLLAVLIVLTGAAFPIWLLRSTRYAFTDTHLTVRSGPLTWKVLLAEIRTVKPTRNPLSSPALSLDRLRIDYGRGRSIMISPRDQAAFLRELDARRARLTPSEGR